jgi:hypothetical protein
MVGGVRMNVRVVAAAQIGSFIAVDEEGWYYVLTLDDGRRGIDCGDVLAGRFDGSGGLFYSVRNLTKQGDVRICLESWESTVVTAIGTVLSFMSSRPGKIFVGGKEFKSDAPGVGDRLREAILRAG